MSKLKIQLGDVPTTEHKRDAVHVAVIPMYAYEELNPGDSVRVRDVNQCYKVERGGVGIVDPFRKGPIATGARFWLVMNPGAVNDLRHEWSHETIVEDAEDKAEEDYYDECRGC